MRVRLVDIARKFHTSAGEIGRAVFVLLVPLPAVSLGTLASASNREAPQHPLEEHERWLNGTITRLAGTGTAGFSGDGGSARHAQLNGPAGLAVDCRGNVYIADLRNHSIRRVDARTQLITTVAGCGARGFSGDGGPAERGCLNAPEGVAVDADGNLYIADSGNQRIRRIRAHDGTIHTVAGTGETGCDLTTGPALQTRLNHPSGVAVDSAGNVYFNDYANDVIHRIDRAGSISVYVGTGMPGYSGDGGAAARAKINDVYGIAMDRTGALYFADGLNFCIRRIDPVTSTIETVLGHGEPGPVVEFVPVSDARLGGVAHAKGTIGSAVAHGLEVDRAGNVFVAETGIHRIRMLHRASGRFFTIAGTGETGSPQDGEPAVRANLDTHGIRVGPDGTVYSVDFLHHAVYAIRFPAPNRVAHWLR